MLSFESKSLRRLDFVYIFVFFIFYLVFLLRGLDIFPLYFFCDEAIPAVDADSLLRTGRDSVGAQWPLFFAGLGDYALSTTVYLQMPFVALFGMNVKTVRLFTVLISVIGVYVTFKLVKKYYKGEIAWTAFPLFAITPSWFVHSRTGFEYVPATVFYLLFLYTYVTAMYGKARQIIVSALFAALAFMTYTPARGWVLVSITLLFVFNLRTHIKLWRHTLTGLLGFLIFLSPYIVFHITNPTAAVKRLNATGYLEFAVKSSAEKIEHISKNYISTLDPRFWVTVQGSTSCAGERHLIPELPLIPPLVAFFGIVGFFYILFHLNKLENRSLVAFLLAAPSSASLVSINHERTIPVAAIIVLLSVIGINVFHRLFKDRKLNQVVPILLAFLFLFHGYAFSNYVHNVAPRKYRDYGFYGVQMGAKEVFHWINGNISNYDFFYISQGLFNGVDVFPKFFLPAGKVGKVKFPFIEELCRRRIFIPQNNSVWFVSPQKWRELISTGCPLQGDVVDIIRDPRGEALIYAMKVTILPDHASWVTKSEEKERKRREALNVTKLNYHGEQISVRHHLIAGDISSLFSGSNNNVVRVDRINPTLFEIDIPQKPLHKIKVRLANTTRASVVVETRNLEEVVSWGEKKYSQARKDSEDLVFLGPESGILAQKVVVKISLPDWGPDGSPHLSGISWE